MLKCLDSYYKLEYQYVRVRTVKKRLELKVRNVYAFAFRIKEIDS